MSDKLGAKSNKCLFVGYPKETLGYYFYNPLEQKVFVARNAVFLEKQFLLKEASGSKIKLDKVHETQMDVDQPIDPKPITHEDEIIGESQIQAPRRSIRVCSVPERYRFLME